MAEAKRVVGSKDFVSGIVFLAIGGAFFALGRGYSMGTGRSMGPGYFPTLLSVLLMAVGAVLAVKSALKPGEATPVPAFRKLAVITVSVVAFGLLLRPLGLVPAILALVLIAAPLSVKHTWKATALLAVGLAAGSSLVFVVLLGLPLPLFGSVFGG